MKKLLLVPLLVLFSSAAGAEPDPWLTLDQARQKIVSGGPLAVDFQQTLVPAGFTGGDSETGTLYLDLPACLRWDYSDPYRRSFLVCGSVGHHWNEGEAVGQRFFVSQEEPGLDLLLQEKRWLAERYDASTKIDGTRRVIRLVPVDEQRGELAEAHFELGLETGELLGLSYRDREGNLSRFELSRHRALEPAGHFDPPTGVVWTER